MTATDATSSFPGFVISSTSRPRPRRSPRRSALRGFEVASIEPLGRRRRGHRLRDHRQPAGLPERPRPRARSRDGLRPAARDAVADRDARRSGSPRLPVAATPTASTVTHRRRGAVPAVRGGGGGRHRGAVAGLDDGAAAGGRRPPDQPHRRHHQLRELSSSAIRCTRSIWRSWRAPEIRVRRARPGETITTLDGVDADARSRHAGHRRPRSRAGGRRRDGRRGLGSVARRRDRRLRERVFQAGIGSPDEQAPRTEDRGVVAIRARRRHRRPGRWRSSAPSR